LGVLCYPWYGTGYSGLSTSFSHAPTFSWTVEVIAHEIGHNLGSPHTHSCSWGPNGNEAIDCCGTYAGYDECGGNCNAVEQPEEGGSIMSYCHLTSAGINFNHGFGPYPLERILNNIANAECLTTCGDNGGDDGGNDCTTYYRDADMDGYGNANDSIESCDGTAPDGYVANSDDCDDGVATVYPGAPCSEYECEGVLSDSCALCMYGTDASNYYADMDADGFGDRSTMFFTCQPWQYYESYSMNGDDCDDSNA
jgi:hypothetical protein